MGNIKIIVERRRTPASAATHRTLRTPKGIIKRKPEDDYLFRRLSKTDTAYLKFYDLGQLLADGNFIDLQRFVSVTAEPQDNGSVITNEPVFADYKSRDDYLVGFGVENFETLFRKFDLDRGRYFGLGFYDNFTPILSTTDSDKWTDNGLSLTPEQLAVGNLKIFNSTASFYDLVLTGFGKMKTTLTYNFAAVDAGYTPQASDVFFLVPEFCRVSSDLTRDSSALEKLIGDATFLPRAPFIDPADPNYKKSSVRSYFQGYSTDADFTDVKNLLDVIKDACAGHLQYFHGDYVFNYDWTALPGADYPGSPALGDAPDGSIYSFGASFAPYNSSSGHGTLAAIIKQGATFFYMWR